MSSQAPEKEGWLNKQGSINKRFQKRWFVLVNNELKYYKSPENLVEQGKINLEGCSVDICPETKYKKKFCFELSSPMQSRVYVMEADNGTTLQDWMNSIRRAMLRIRREKSKMASAARQSQASVSSSSSAALSTDDSSVSSSASDSHANAVALAQQYVRSAPPEDTTDHNDVYRQWLEESRGGKKQGRRTLLDENKSKDSCCGCCLIM